jgi:hypothetical protein
LRDTAQGENNVTDSIIYEAQPIPPEDPKDAKRKRWSAIFGAVSIVAILLVGIAFGAALFRGDDDPEPLAEADSTKPTVTVQTTTTMLRSPLADRTQRFGGGDYASEDGAASTRPYRPGGDVGTPTPALPIDEFTWERVTLDLPEGQEAYLQGVYPVGDGFIALAMSWSESGGQDMFAWTSADGSVWTPTDLNGDFSDANVWNVVFTEYGAIAFGEQWIDYEFADLERSYRPPSPERLIWTSPDGINWTRSALDLTAAENQEVWINTGVAGPGGYVVVGQRSTSPEFEPMVFETGGFTVELNEYSYTYRVLNASGAVVAEGSMEDFYNSQDQDGQAIVNPETGELLTVIPWETWEAAYEEAYRESAGGPFGGFGYVAPILTIEYDGYRIILNEETFTYRIEDIASGELISEGNADYLWRGPAPVITDASGAVILSLTWEEFDAAQQAFWEGRDGEYDYRSEVVVATSPDGITWTEGTVEALGVVSAYQEVSFDSIIAHGDGYLAFGSQYDEFGGGASIWTSPDGLTWTQEADMPGGMYIWNVKQAADGTLLAIGDGPQGPALWSSTDGIAWGEAFGTRIPEDRNLVEWLNQFGTGDLGTVIVGSRDSNYYLEEYYAEPFTFTRDDYTLTFDDYDMWPPQVTVVDDITGDIVIDVRLGEDGELPEGFSYEDGVTYVEHNDIVLMAITDDEWYEAQEARWMEIEGLYAETEYVSTPTMYFSTDLSEWVEVPFEFKGWIGHIAVGADVVVLAGEEYQEEPRLLESDEAASSTVTTVSGGADIYFGEDEFYYEPPNPVLFIGRP